MVDSMPPINNEALVAGQMVSKPRLIPRDLRVEKKQDTVELGQQGAVSNAQAQNIVLERAMEKLRNVVQQARAELGLSDNTILDTSPEATANRIADFALGFYSQYAENNGLEDSEESRSQYAEFIGEAIGQGINEARDILTALNSLSDNVNSNIDTTHSLVQDRLDNFVANGLS